MSANTQLVVYLALVGNQLLAVLAFIGLYGTDGSWRRTVIGRHVMYWVVATGIVDLSWMLLLVVKAPWLVYVLFVAQALVGAVTWQRVWLVWKARHR